MLHYQSIIGTGRVYDRDGIRDIVWHLVPNSASVGFQSLGPGTGETKMHAPKNWNSPGTLLEPFTVGLQSGANGKSWGLTDQKR